MVTVVFLATPSRGVPSVVNKANVIIIKAVVYFVVQYS